MNCPCGSSKEYNICCERVHKDLTEATTAEMLMRARYSAFVKQNIDFLYQTYHPKTRKFQNKNEIKQWATESKWMHLVILHSTTNTVEFEAHYLDDRMETQVHHEKSNFKKNQDLWYYVDGTIIF